MQRSLARQIGAVGAAHTGGGVAALDAWTGALAEALLPQLQDELGRMPPQAARVHGPALRICLELRRIEAVLDQARGAAGQQPAADGAGRAAGSRHFFARELFSPFVYAWLEETFAELRPRCRAALQCERALTAAGDEGSVFLVLRACHLVVRALRHVDVLGRGELVTASQLMADLLGDALRHLEGGHEAAVRGDDDAVAQLRSAMQLLELSAPAAEPGSPTDDALDTQELTLSADPPQRGAEPSHGSDGHADPVFEGCRHVCLRASQAWQARRWLCELVDYVEGSLAAWPEQQRIATASFADASAALKRVADERAKCVTEHLLAQLEPAIESTTAAPTPCREGRDWPRAIDAVCHWLPAGMQSVRQSVGFTQSLPRGTGSLRRAHHPAGMLARLMQRCWLDVLRSLHARLEQCMYAPRALGDAFCGSAVELLDALREKLLCGGDGPSRAWMVRSAAPFQAPTLLQPAWTPPPPLPAPARAGASDSHPH